MRLQKVTWRMQRLGWAAIFVLILLAVLGLFSNGPLSSTTAADDARRIVVEYDRFQRNGALADMQVDLAVDHEGMATLVASPAFVEAFQIEAMTPEPVEQRGGPDGVALIFQCAGSGSVPVRMFIRPTKIGLIRSAVGLPGEPPVDLVHFVYP
jgi:hypothetical protein